MLHITHNPNNDECPNYGDEDHAAVRDWIIGGHQGPEALTNEAAADKLRAPWQSAQDKVAQWNKQLLQDQATRDSRKEEWNRSWSYRCVRCERKRRRVPNERLTARRPNINDFGPDSVVPGYITPRPSGYALKKIKKTTIRRAGLFHDQRLQRSPVKAQFERELFNIQPRHSGPNKARQLLSNLFQH